MFCSKALSILALWLLLVCGCFATARDGSCSASATSCTFSGTATGDLKIVFAYHHGGTATPSLPAGWTTIAGFATGVSGTTGAVRVGCNVSSSSGDTGSGTWTNATLVVGISYSGTAVGTTANCNTTGIGGKVNAFAQTSTSISYNTITLTKTDWVAGFAGDSAAAPCVPTGMSSVTTTGSGPGILGSDTNAAVSSWSTTTCSVASSTWLSYVLEILNLAPCANFIALTGAGCR